MKMLCRAANNSKYFFLKFFYKPNGKRRRPNKEFLYIFKIKKDNLLSYSDTVNVFICHNFSKNKKEFFEAFLEYRINNLAEKEKKKLYELKRQVPSVYKTGLYFYQHIKPLMSKIKIMTLNDIENFYTYYDYDVYWYSYITVYFRQGKMVLDDTIVFEDKKGNYLFSASLPDITKNFFIKIFSDKIPKELEEWERKMEKNKREKKIRFRNYMYTGIGYVVKDYLTKLIMFRVEISTNGNTKKIEIYLTPYYGAFTKSLEFFEVEIEKEYFLLMMQYVLLSQKPG